MSNFQKDQVQDLYYLSPMQEGMLFHSLMHPDESFYVEQVSMKINGRFRAALLEKSMQTIMDRYDIFRTVFVHEKMKRPLQVVLKKRTFKVKEVDLSGLSDDEQEKHISAFKRTDRKSGFDLSKDILMRATVFKKGEASYEWIWSYHHILLDGWCFGIIAQELFQTYEALLHNRPNRHSAVKPYKEYIHWLEKQDKQKSLDYWDRYLSGFEGQKTFAEQRKKKLQDERDPEEVFMKLTEQETRAFSEIARKEGVTLNSAFQAAWAILLNRYQFSDDVIFGTVVSGRPSEIDGVESMVGVFINVVPKRIRLDQEQSFKQLIKENQRQTLESEKDQYVPLYEIQSKVGQPGLIDHIFVFENYPIESANEDSNEQGLGFAVEETDGYEKSNYDLNVLASPGKELLVKFAFNVNLFEKAFILRLKDQLYRVIQQICVGPHIPLKDIEMVTEEEKQTLLETFNQPFQSHKDGLTITEHFERFAKEMPDQKALVCGDQILTYSELNAKANQLARVLRANGVNRGESVGLCLDRTPNMVIGLLAILKAGGAYLPIDPNYPVKRIRYMLEDSGTKLLLTQHDFQSGYDDETLSSAELLFIDNPGLYCGITENLDHAREPDDIAYIMYTSGTTGKPKGILTTDSNVTRVAKQTNYIDITESDTLLSLSNYAFDGFTFDLFGALLNGAKLVIASNDTILNVTKLINLIESEGITVMFTTTALFNLLVDEDAAWMNDVRKVLFGGEQSSASHARKALEVMGPDRIIHVYGPTETTVFATFYPVNEIAEDAGTIPIGKPLNLTEVYVMNPMNQLQPIGAPGELCISGEGLSKGYLNRPVLTQEKFIDHPFIPGEKLYKSGDLGRRLPDGNLEFIERIGNQVKIRGHRIELSEIEDHLLQLPGLKNAVVLTDQDESGDKLLSAYIVTHEGGELFLEAIQKNLAQSLPDYMVPQAFVFMDQLPLTHNGKVDRGALHAVQEKRNKKGNQTPPRTEIETKLINMWKEVLGVNEIGIHDNFFALGGHSLKAMALCAKILKALQIDIPVGFLFKYPTVSELAECLTNGGEEENDDQSKSEITVLNPNASQNLFLFPPVLGYGIMFSDLAKQLPEYRLYACDFIEEGNRIELYTDRLIEKQPEGAFVLLGYSAGCALAFEVAKSLENRGRTVSQIIMLDSYRKIAVSQLENRTVEQDVDALMEANKDNPYLQMDAIRKGISRKMKVYYTYFVELVNTGNVQGQIHLIKSESDLYLPKWMSPWEEATTESYREQQGYGKHDEMLQVEFIEKNARIIRRILQEGKLKNESVISSFR